MSKNVWDKAKAAWRVRTISSSTGNAPQPFITTLGTAEQFLMSALRLWGNGRSQNALCCCRNLLRNGFQAAGLSRMAFEQFDRAVGLIDGAMALAEVTDTTHTDWIMPLSSHVVAPYEVQFLRTLMLCQHGQPREAMQALSLWLPPTAVRIVLSDLVNFARACAANGLVLTERPALYSDHAIEMGALRPPHTLVH